MHSIRAQVWTRGLAVAALRNSRAVTRNTTAAAKFVRFNSTEAVIPKSMQPRSEELAQGVTKTVLGDLDASSPPANIRPELWTMYVATLRRLVPESTWPPKRRVLHWMLLNAETREELDLTLTLTEQWRMHMLPITQATTHLWSQACARLKYPEPFMRMLLDRWKYRQLPVAQTLAMFMRFLGTMGAESDAADEMLDDVFKVFALYEYYDIPHNAQAYGALVEACCEINTEEAWRRALVASEETLAEDTPMITLEALNALERRSVERNESEMAARYRDLAKRLDLKPASKKEVQFDDDSTISSPGFD
ncbi:hypothetical protein IW148_003320 [Coemansia sp. RSA 1199]|nr:hypothetical protein IW148_003320 [Coemansia sp. RSA 1199]